MTTDQIERRIRERLTSRARVELPDEEGLRRAAVLMPLYRAGDEHLLLLTRRTEAVEHHKGQISFPGGAREPDDPDLLHTALRETEEETGIPPGVVEVLGALDDVYTVVSGFVVTPYVGVVPYPYPLTLNAQEISELVMVPLAVFRDPANLRVERRERDGVGVPVYFYTYDQHVIWGLTGRIIKSLIDLVWP